MPLTQPDSIFPFFNWCIFCGLGVYSLWMGWNPPDQYKELLDLHISILHVLYLGHGGIEGIILKGMWCGTEEIATELYLFYSLPFAQWRDWRGKDYKRVNRHTNTLGYLWCALMGPRQPDSFRCVIPIVCLFIFLYFPSNESKYTHNFPSW